MKMTTVNKSKRIRELEREVDRLEREAARYKEKHQWVKERLEMVKDAWSIAHPVDVAYMRKLSNERLRVCRQDHWNSDASKEIMRHPDFYTQLMGEWGRPLPNGKVARRAGSFELAESYRREQLELRIEQIQEDNRCYR
jgi:hypothetical protein